MRILLVDDSLTMLRITEKSLKKVGYSDIVLAGTGKMALNILDDMAEPYLIDLVLLDWHMPEMDGLQVLKHIKKNSAYKNIPVIMLTQEQNKKNVILAIQNGAADYIIKPLNAHLLKEKINKLFPSEQKKEEPKTAPPEQNKIATETEVSEQEIIDKLETDIFQPELKNDDPQTDEKNNTNEKADSKYYTEL